MTDPAKRPAPPTPHISTPSSLPRVTITYCIKCKWMFRATYFAQELLSTFEGTIGEVALRPGGTGEFIVELWYTDGELGPDGSQPKVQSKVLWDFKVNRGFPETKILKRLVRDVIDPGRNMGHVDRVTSGVAGDGDKGNIGEGTQAKDEKGGWVADVANKQQKIIEKSQGELVGGRETKAMGPSTLRRDADGAVCEDCT
ncbi:MAG: hypothetical protein M1824_003991 [Vezdaea acicularis]|nr:MAG: hypothetical protein M1824_003991 [Vezdaea acicularis]